MGGTGRVREGETGRREALSWRCSVDMGMLSQYFVISAMQFPVTPVDVLFFIRLTADAHLVLQGIESVTMSGRE